MPKRKVLFYKLANNDPTMVQNHGFYERWFERVLGPDRLEVHEGHRCTSEVGQRPDPRDYAGFIVSGSPSSLCRRESWMDDASEAVRRAAEAGVPVLGVCFGHQLIAHAWGGVVTENPLGWEVGSVEVSLNERGRGDALFSGLPPTLLVNQTHQDHVAELGPGMLALAGNTQTPTQAIAVGDNVRGVQFHPEISGSIVRAYIRKRHDVLELDVEKRRRPHSDRPGVRHDQAIDTPQGEQVLMNFDRHFVSKS